MQDIVFDDTEKEFTVRFAREEDIPGIMKFIKEYWSEGHILANNREMFEFQYVYGDEVCFVLSQNNKTGQIEGVLGYIPYETDGERDIFTALWKVRKGKNLFQGIDLLTFLEQNARCRDLFCAGINPKTFSIYKYMKKIVTKMNHYYLLNDLDDYKIARIEEKKIMPVREVPYTVRKIQSVEELDIFDANAHMQERPVKGKQYIDRRFFHHIKYNYEIYKVETQGEVAYILGREQAQNDATIFRIMQLWGSDQAIANTGAFLKNLLLEKAYEYIDCFAYGIPEEIMEKAGFAVVQEQDANIIPNYFEPFVRENTEIHIFVPRDVKTRMFKGDGDQDRPNYIIEE